MALTRTVNLKLFAETAKAQAELDAIMNEAVALGKLNPTIKPAIEKSAALRQMAVLRGELKAQGDAAGKALGAGIADGTKKGLGSKGGGGSWIAAAIGLGAPLTGPLAAGGLAFSAFGLLAAGSLAPVVKAMSGPGGLTAGWASLNARQKTAAAGVEALKTRYDALSASLQPRTFQVFNTALSTANSLLGPLGKLAAASGAGVERFLVQFENDAGLQKFIGWASTVAPQAIGLLGTDVTTLVHSVLTLAQAAGGTGLFELRLLTAGLQALDKVISVLPGPLEGAALGVGGLALALAKLGVLMPLLRLSGLAGALTAAKAAMAATAVEADAAAVATAALGGAEVATAAETGVLAAAMTALDEVNPFFWVAAAVAGLGALAFWASKVKTATDRQVTSIEKQTNAQGFNTAGYFAAAKAIAAANAQQEKQQVTLRNVHTGMVTGTTSVGDLTGATQTNTAAVQENLTAYRNQTTFLGILQDKYGLTQQSAVSLARKSGVLASQVDKGGQSMRDAVTQAEAYANSNLAAQRPTTQLAQDMQDFANKTLTAATRTTALTNALKLFFDPAVAADQDLITLKDDQVALAKALKASGGNTGLLTQKQRDARGAFDTYISQVTLAATDAQAATGKTSDYNRVINNALPGLEKAAGHNKALRLEIQKLKDTLPVKSEHVSITVDGKGHFSVTSLRTGPGGKQTSLAAGGLIRGGVPGRDSVPIMAMPGELVVPTPIVSSGAVDHLRGKIPGFAQGGVVGSYGPGSLAGLGSWIGRENAATLRAVESATAMATLAGMRKAQATASAQTFGGGLGRASLRQIENWWIQAGGPGGGTAHVAAAITGPESGFNVRAVQQGQPYATTGWGLWQITPGNSEPQAGIDAQLLTGPANARAAVAKYRGAGGFSPWTTFNNGAYLKYMASGGVATPGWTVLGERGPELAYMRGGEPVLSHSQSVQAGMGGRPGLAAGTLTPKQAAALAARNLRKEQTAGLSLVNYYASPGTAAGIRSEETRYLRDIAKYFEGTSAKWRDKAVERQTGRLIDVRNQLSTLGSRLASARSYQQSVQQGLSGYADLSTTTLGGSMVGSRTLSAGASLQGQLGQRLSSLKKFGQVLGKLSAAHADASLIRQVVAIGQSDPVAGVAYGQELLSGGPRLIRALNREESAIGQAELNISRGAASSVFEGKYQPGRHFLQQLQGDRAGLEHLFRDLGKTLGEEAARWFRVPKGRRPKGFASGGVLTEPVLGYGASGQAYTFAESGYERFSGTTSTPPPAQRPGPLVHIENFNPREVADVTILAQQLSFTVTRAGFG